MVKRWSKIALALMVSGPILAGCAKSPFATSSDGSSPTQGGASLGSTGSTGGGSGAGLAASSGGGSYGHGAIRPNVKDFVANPQLKDIRFDFDRYEIRAEDAEILDANAESLKANPKMQILIEGHTDQRGTTEYNMALADRRAKASMNYLVSRGVRANRITVISYGKERPVCGKASEDCWSQNRRAHFMVKGQ
jgi:peptidoglycan-associated lipoprotein